jgi:hypothetical protein
MKWIVSTLVLLTAIAVVADRNPMVPSSTLPKPEVVYRDPYDGYQSAEECLAAKWEAGVSMEHCATVWAPTRHRP